MNLEKEQNVLFELIAIIIGAIVGGILFISFLTYDFKSDASSNVMVESKIKENIQPVAKVELAQAVAEGSASAGKSGEEVYKAVCSMCHQAGILNAPKLGDTQAWASRISQGYETLVQHAIKGIRSMPAKGGNASLSDAEVAGAVLYMTNSSGASFKK
ncbi:MAG: c-type cytochrome [Candidatus Methylopumilus sp.]|jgi:cytochrome c5|nr:cytochrome c5 family protein [Betaproteobacteria bacterium]